MDLRSFFDQGTQTLMYGIAAIIAVAILTGVLVSRHMHNKQLSKSYIMCDIKLRRLSPASPTRRRLTVAQQLFAKAWKALKSKQPYDCLTYFAAAVEIDELGCGWKQSFESKLEQIGDFFTLPAKDNADKYTSFLAEGYLVVLLYTVLSLMGKQEGDLEEDFQTVKSRLTVCVKLQPQNPMIYKLRADMLQRFGHLANRTELMQDFETAIKLAEKDTEGRQLNCEGLDRKEQRNYVLAYCHHQLATLQHRNKELDAAADNYAKAVSYADPDFVNLADCHFALCILTLMLSRKVGPLEKPGVLLKAMQHYKAGLMADKQCLKYLPFVTTDVSRQLAKELTKKFAKS